MNVYEFYVDGDKFYDVRIDELALIDPTLQLELNGAGTFTFTIPYTHPKYNSFNPLTSTIEIYRDGEWFWEGRIIDKTGDFYNEITYTVEGALGYLNDSIQPQAEFHDVTPIGYVEQLLNVHNSQVPDNRKINLGAITVRDPNNSMYRYTNYNSTLQELKEDVIDDLGGIITLRKVNGELYLDIFNDYNRICEQVIRLGENLIDLAPSFDFKSIKSVIIPLGATLEDQESHEEGLDNLDKYVEITEVNDGKNYIARDDLLDKYNQIWGVVQFNDIHTPQNLLSKAEEYLKDAQWGEMVIEAKAFDLNYTSEEFQEFRLGDRVRVKSEYHGLDRYFPLTAQTIYFNNVSQNTITLGGTGEPVSITGVTNQVTINTQKLDDRIKDPNRLIQQAIYQATQLITQGLNGYVRVNGDEILIMDTEDPETARHVWRWNMGGLGYSNNGYNGPFETAITMDGTIVGKFIAANSIAAEQLDVNYKSHVERLISDAESGANGYTDSKLGDYWTYAETETYFKTLADSIEAGVNTTLKGYVTEQTLESQLKITESNITTTVTNSFNSTLNNYSTTKTVQSMIDQSAESITTTLSRNFVSRDDLGQLQTDVSNLEQKITADGIFTTINSGLAGTRSLKTTKFTMDKDGLTIQNGGITIKNNSGNNVLWADTSGNLTLRGDYVQYDDTYNNKVWEITDNQINLYHYRTGRQLLRILMWTDTSVALDTMNSSALEFGVNGSTYVTLSRSLIKLGGSFDPDPTIDIEGNVNITSSSLRVRYVTPGYQPGTYSTGYNGTLNGCRFINGICVGSG